MNALEIIERIGTYPTVDHFKCSLGKILATLGFDSWAYTVKMPDSFSGSSFDVIHTWNQEFVDRYVKIHAPYCPRLNHLWQSEQPLIYDKKFHDDDLKRLSQQPPKVKVLIEEIIDFGYHGHGFSLTTHGKYGDKGVLTLQNRDWRQDGVDAIALNFHVASAFFPFMHMKYIELKGWKPPGSIIQLTERELECLRWAADGKTAWETGMVLNVSERTVNFHMTNAQKKLMASNKIQTVARAILYNLL